MRSLLIEVTEAPRAHDLSPSDLNAYPQLLLDEMQLWRRMHALRPEELQAAVELYQPSVLAFLGESAVTQAWLELSEQLFPRLFALAHPLAPSETVIDGINARSWILRRRRLAPRPPDPVTLPPPGPAEPANGRDTRPAVQALLASYPLAAGLETLGAEQRERGLNCLALLDQTLALRPASLLDIGCHVWSYALSLRAFIGAEGHLTGVEIDPWYLQADGLTRGDWARRYAHLAQGSYLEGDPRELDLPPQALITLFLPLILPENALRWGLPLAHHQPGALLLQARRLLTPDGQLLIYTGVEREYSATLALLAELRWQPLAAHPYVCPLRQQEQGYVILLRP